VTVRDLVINALRMRPDRIIVGEVRGGEALDMLQAMNTGHEGSMTTLHANDPHEALLRLQTMVLLAGTELPAWAILEQIGEALQLLLHIDRFTDGTRRIVSVVEIAGRNEEQINLRPLFSYSEESGQLEPTGNVPQFLGRLAERGIEIPPIIFRDPTPQQSFIDLWLGQKEREPSRPALPGRLDWPTRYRVVEQVKSWLLQQVGPDTTLERDPTTTQMLAEGLGKALAQEGLILGRNERQALQALVEAEVLGYGPLDPLLADDEINEIMVNGPNTIYVER